MALKEFLGKLFLEGAFRFPKRTNIFLKFCGNSH